MKTTTLLIILLFVQVSFSQSRFEKDSIQAYTIIKDNIEELEQKGIYKSIFIYDSSGRLVLIWKDHKKYRAIRASYREKQTKMFKPYRLSRKNKSDLNEVLANPEMLNQTSNVDCDRDVYSFTKISIDINKKEFNGSFLTNCPQNKSLRPLKSLYYSLFRDRW